MKLERLGEQKKSRYNKKREQHLDHYLPFKLNVDKDLELFPTAKTRTIIEKQSYNI